MFKMALNIKEILNEAVVWKLFLFSFLVNIFFRYDFLHLNECFLKQVQSSRVFC